MNKFSLLRLLMLFSFLSLTYVVNAQRVFVVRYDAMESFPHNSNPAGHVNQNIFFDTKKQELEFHVDEGQAMKTLIINKDQAVNYGYAINKAIYQLEKAKKDQKRTNEFAGSFVCGAKVLGRKAKKTVVEVYTISDFDQDGYFIRMLVLEIPPMVKNGVSSYSNSLALNYTNAKKLKETLNKYR